MVKNTKKAVRAQGLSKSLRVVSNLVLLITLVLPVFQVQAEVYKWVDDNGRVHFSDRPTSSKSTEVRIREQQRSQAPADDPDRQLKMQRMLNSYEEDRAQKKETMQKQQEERKKRRLNCTRAKDRYNSHTRASGIYDLGEDGKRRYLSEKERSQHMQRLKSEIARWCK